MKILLSRTDKIGDVALTLPMAGVIKKHFPNSYIYFLGTSYTQHIVERSTYVDAFLNWDELRLNGLIPAVEYFLHIYPNKEIAWLAKEKQIRYRVGTSHRLFHWGTCNRLIHFTRKRSPLHESQLNLKLLSPLKINDPVELGDMYRYIGWKRNNNLIGEDLLSSKFNLIMHTKSRGSAKEWKLQNYLEVIKMLPKNEVQVYLSGTKEEGLLIREECPDIFNQEHVTDITGRFTLEEFICFIEKCDGLLACSTGPLHIASSAGIKCIGLYPATRPMHAGRWSPIGKNSHYLSEEKASKDHLLQIEVKKVVSSIKELMH